MVNVPEDRGGLTDSRSHTGKAEKLAPGRRNETAEGERWETHQKQPPAVSRTNVYV